MSNKFTPVAPFVTRNGYEVLSVVLSTRIVGIVKYDNHSAIFAEWDKKGKKVGMYQRDKGQTHDLDLVNLEVYENEHGTGEHPK